MDQISNTHHDLEQLFPALYLRHVMNAISAGNSPAVILADNPVAPTSAFIWDKAHCLYFGGAVDHAEYMQELQQHLMKVILPEARSRQLGLLKLYRTHSGWDSFLDATFSELDLREGQRVLYIRQPEVELILPSPLPDGFHIVRIDETILNQEISGLREMTDEIESCWPSISQFLETGFGYCALHADDGVLCWCTAEYVSPGMCGVGIETIEAYQGQGIATATAHAFMNHAAEQDMTVFWDSWLGNLPSIRVAEKLGLRKVADYSVKLIIIQ